MEAVNENIGVFLAICLTNTAFMLPVLLCWEIPVTNLNRMFIEKFCGDAGLDADELPVLADHFFDFETIVQVHEWIDKRIDSKKNQDGQDF